MNKIFLLIISGLLLILTSCDEPANVDRGSDKRLRLGSNGGITYIPILAGNKATKYGYSEVNFKKLNSTYAVFSVPSGEATETHFNMEIVKNDSYPCYLVGSLKSTPGVSILIDNISQNYINPGTGTNSLHQISFSGQFIEFSQENVITIGYDKMISSTESAEEMATYIDRLTSTIKQNIKENSVYIVAYSWRTINVYLPNADEATKTAVLEYANNTFNQAICKLVEAEETDYDCRIDILTDGKAITFIDEDDKEYSKKNSNYLRSCKINKNSGSLDRNVSYAIAYLLGVSLGNETGTINLMDETGSGTHLTFRQWNQLH